jgi:Protein of unknown function (DUF3352)
VTSRRTLVAAAVLAVAAVAAVVLLVGRGERPPATGAARLVPDTALAYLHVSTDRDRDAVRRADQLLRRFSSGAEARDAVTSRLTSIGPGLSYRRDVRPWLGLEAAVALLDTPGPTATPVAVVAVANRARADAFLGRASRPPAASAYQGVTITSYGGLATAFLGRYLVVGPPAGVQAAIDVRGGRIRALDRSPAFRRATAGLPADRAVDAYLPAAGVSRLLAAQSSALGAAGALLQQPGLVATGLSLSAEGDGARLRVHSVIDRSAAGPRRFLPFEPRLLDSVPGDALGYLGVSGLDRSAGSLLPALAGGAAPAVARLLARAAGNARRAGLDLEREVAPVFRGEVALWLNAAAPAPALTLIARTRDERATRQALARLQRPLITALAPPARGPGQAAVFEQQAIAGVQAFRLRLGPGVELDYAVFDGKVVISTALQAIADARRSSEALPDTPGFRATLGDRPQRVTSMVFLDFAKLLGLVELSTLATTPAYQSIRADLHKIRAVGAASWGGRAGSTTDVSIALG